MREGRSENYGFNLAFTTEERIRAENDFKSIGNFWTGGDVSVSKKREIPSLEVITPHHKEPVSVFLNRNNLPPIDLTQAHFDKLLLKTSTRSCYAQVGVEVEPLTRCLTTEDIEAINNGKTVECPAVLMNWGGRPVEVSGPLFRFFWVNPDHLLQGNNLATEVRSKIKIDGQEGKDWTFGKRGEIIEDGVFQKIDPDKLGREHGDEDDPITLRLPIKKQKFWIPPTTEPIQISSKTDLSRVLEPYKETGREKPFFIVAETPKIVMPPDLIALIEIGKGEEVNDHTRHLSSSLIDPGFSGPIRLELVNFDRFPTSIEFLIYKK